MKVTYRNSDTTTIEIETSEEIAVTLTESYRKEDNLARKSAHHASCGAQHVHQCTRTLRQSDGAGGRGCV